MKCSESALVQWGSGSYSNQGWIRYNRHGLGANYIYYDAPSNSYAGPRPASTNTPTTSCATPSPTRRSSGLLVGACQGGSAWAFFD